MQPSYFPEALADCFGEEGREFWTDDDRHWRSALAGIKRRGRASKLRREAALER